MAAIDVAWFPNSLATVISESGIQGTWLPIILRNLPDTHPRCDVVNSNRTIYSRSKYVTENM